MKVEAGTVARTFALGLALLNQILTSFGYQVIDVSDDEIYTLVSTLFTVVTAIIAFWKNNSFTPEAIEADKVMRELKSANKE